MSASADISGRLEAKVEGLEHGHNELRKEFHALDQKMDAGFLNLSSKLDNKTALNWQPVAILVTVLIAIGGALYWPVRESMSKHELQIEFLRAQIVPRVEHDKLWKDNSDRDRVTEDRMRKLWEEHNNVVRDLSYLRGQLHPLK